MEIDNNQIKLLVLWDILYNQTDENHALNADELQEELQKRGISVIPRVIASNIRTLNKAGYEVAQVRRKHICYYVDNRPVDTAEVVMLADVIKASKLSATQKNNLISKLSNTLLGAPLAKSISDKVIFPIREPLDGGHIIYTIDAIESAIKNNQRISFRYFDYTADYKKAYRRDGEIYIVDPMAMMWNKDNYYLLCFTEGHDNLSTYRLDKMDEVTIEKTKRTPRSDYENFDTEEYRRQVFSMFDGELQNITLRFHSDLLSEIFDKFGKVNIFKISENMYSTEVAVRLSKPFYLWVAGSQGKIHITAPVNAVKEFDDFVDKIKAAY